MKSNMSVEVEFLAGTSLQEALEEAVGKANFWRVAYVKFKFNGVKVSVRATATYTDILHALDQYNLVLQEDSKIKLLIC